MRVQRLSEKSPSSNTVSPRVSSRGEDTQHANPVRSFPVSVWALFNYVGRSTPLAGALHTHLNAKEREEVLELQRSYSITSAL